jgi:hypothetical protein
VGIDIFARWGGERKPSIKREFYAIFIFLSGMFIKYFLNAGYAE